MASSVMNTRFALLISFVTFKVVAPQDRVKYLGHESSLWRKELNFGELFNFKVHSCCSAL